MMVTDVRTEVDEEDGGVEQQRPGGDGGQHVAEAGWLPGPCCLYSRVSPCRDASSHQQRW